MSMGTVDRTGAIHKPAGVAGAGQFNGRVNSAPAAALDAPPALHPLQQRFDTLEEKMQAVQDELAAGVEALSDDENWQRHLDVMSRFPRYSFNNQILISIQCPHATRVAGAKVWKSMGRYPRKGSKGLAVLAPVMVTAKDKDDNPILDEATGKPKMKLVRYTTRAVFDVSQTDGEPLPEVWKELSAEPPAGFINDLEDAIRARGFQVVYEKTGSSARGYASPDRKVVVVDPDLTPGSRAATLAHELGHIACGHLDRMDEYHTGHGGSRGQMEVEAESFGYVLARMNGMQMETKPASEYVASWKQYDSSALKAVGDTVQKAVRKTVEAGSWRNLQEDS